MENYAIIKRLLLHIYEQSDLRTRILHACIEVVPIIYWKNAPSTVTCTLRTKDLRLIQYQLALYLFQ